VNFCFILRYVGTFLVCDGLTDVDDEPLVTVRRLVVVRRQGEATQVIVVATCTPDS